MGQHWGNILSQRAAAEPFAGQGLRASLCLVGVDGRAHPAASSSPPTTAEASFTISSVASLFGDIQAPKGSDDHRRHYGVSSRLRLSFTIYTLRLLNPLEQSPEVAAIKRKHTIICAIQSINHLGAWKGISDTYQPEDGKSAPSSEDRSSQTASETPTK